MQLVIVGAAQLPPRLSFLCPTMWLESTARMMPLKSPFLNCDGKESLCVALAENFCKKIVCMCGGAAKELSMRRRLCGDGVAWWCSGDADQLPPVGAGSFLSAAIGSGAVPVIDLRQVFRQVSLALAVECSLPVTLPCTTLERL